jgi:hypothetical protein
MVTGARGHVPTDRVVPEPSPAGAPVAPDVTAATDALLTLKATGMGTWDALLALLDAGLALGAFPELRGVPAHLFVPYAELRLAVQAFDAWGQGHPEGANALLNLYLKDRRVAGDLDLENVQWVTNLPEGLRVAGGLNLVASGIRVLPQGLVVGGRLSLWGTAVANLPAGLEAGRLLLLDTPIATLPSDLKVGIDLYLSNTQIRALPDGLKLRGHLELCNTPLRTLPAGLEAFTLGLKGCAGWDGRIPADARIIYRIDTDRFPEGILLDAWRRQCPQGERAHDQP